MKRKREKTKVTSELIRKQIVYHFDMLGHEISIPDVDLANICDDIADDIITMLDSMEEDETDL